MAERTAVLVLGMHRSGTSALTRLFNLLGAALPERLVPPGPGNPLGHWEPLELVALHDTILAAAGSHVYGLFDVAPEWFDSAAAAHFAHIVARTITRNYGAAMLIVVKDPRLSLLVPIWRQALAQLDITPRYIIPFRDPYAVAASLQRREGGHENAALWPLARVVLLWLRYILAAEHASRGAPRSFVSFDTLLADWPCELARLTRQIALSWPRDAAAMADKISAFLKPAERHETATHPVIWPDTLPAHLPAVYHALMVAVTAPDSGAQVFDAARTARATGISLLRSYIEAMETELRRLAPLQEIRNSRSWRLTAPLRTIGRLLASDTYGNKGVVREAPRPFQPGRIPENLAAVTMRDLSADIDGLTADDAGLDSGVTAKCDGGGISRKRRLREKQAAGAKTSWLRSGCPRPFRARVVWSGRRDLNPRPPVPQSECHPCQGKTGPDIARKSRALARIVLSCPVMTWYLFRWHNRNRKPRHGRSPDHPRCR